MLLIRHPIKLFFRTALLLIISLSAGCAHYPLNQQAETYPAEKIYGPAVAETAGNTKSLFVCLAFSGGGTRAAALSYGVLEKLRDTKIRWNGVEKSLLEEVDCISSVSGGSFTSAYYALFGEKLFSGFRPGFLDRNIEGELFNRVFLNPVSWYRLASPYFSRIDAAAELYDETIFDGRTFGDIAQRPGSPYVIINATDVAGGSRFEFEQEQFDYIGSRLWDYPVARAVAASSAFPFLLNPISLKNYPAAPGFTPSQEYVNALKDYDVNRRRYAFARDRMAYIDKEKAPYVHLMDGGLADNIGLRAIDNAYRQGYIRKLINGGEIEKIVIIVVNARTGAPDRTGLKESPPGLMTVAHRTATVSMDNYSFETIQLMEDLLKERQRSQDVIASCQRLLDSRQCGDPPLPVFANIIDPFIIEVNFESIPDAGRREYFLSLPTSFRLSTTQVDSLIAEGRELLEQAPLWNELMNAIGH